MHVNNSFEKITCCKVRQSGENKKNIKTNHLNAFLTLTALLKYYINMMMKQIILVTVSESFC